jgi:hypothetical protein
MKAKTWCFGTIMIVTLLSGEVARTTTQEDGPGESCLPRTFHGKYLVTIGDSIGYGFQIVPFRRVAGTPFVPDEVFPGVERSTVERLQDRGIDVRSLNFSCPGQATADFVTGPCLFHANGFPLHDGLDYTGAQLDAVADFLIEHGFEVGAVTIWLGGNDVFRLVNSCRQSHPADPVACVRNGRSAMIGAAMQNWNAIFDRLQPLAPDAVFIVHLYNDPTSILGWPDGTATFGEYNAALASLGAARNVQVVDLEPIFNRSEQQVCRLTGLCNSIVDVHPSDDGQEVIAKLDLAAVLDACRFR